MGGSARLRARAATYVLASMVVLAGCDGDPVDGGGATTTPTPPEATAGPVDDAGATGADAAAGTATEVPLPDAGDALTTDEPEPTVVEGLAPSVPVEELATASPAPELVTPAVEVEARALAAPEEPDRDQLAAVVAGAALGTIQNTAAEYATLGWTQRGVPEVVSTEVVGLEEDAEPPTATVRVCLDFTDVDVVDSSGSSVLDPDAQQQVLQIWTLQLVDGRWVLVEQGFSAELSC